MPYFHAVDYIPWIGSTLAECLIVGIMLRRNLVRRFPVFFTSIAFDLLREMAFPAVVHYSALAYGYCYWISIPIEYVLAFGVMWEAFFTRSEQMRKFRPRLCGLFYWRPLRWWGLRPFLFFTLIFPPAT
jgi:hypothetical protein